MDILSKVPPPLFYIGGTHLHNISTSIVKNTHSFSYRYIGMCSNYFLLILVPVSPSSSGGGGAGGGSGTPLYPGAASHPLSSLLSQQRLLELSRFGLRHYDIAHHVLSQQGAVTKLLGKQSSSNYGCI